MPQLALVGLEAIQECPVTTTPEGRLEFNVPFQHKYSYIRDDATLENL